MMHVIFGCENYMGIRIVLLPDETLQAPPAFEGMWSMTYLHISAPGDAIFGITII